MTRLSRSGGQCDSICRRRRRRRLVVVGGGGGGGVGTAGAAGAGIGAGAVAIAVAVAVVPAGDKNEGEGAWFLVASCVGRQRLVQHSTAAASLRSTGTSTGVE